MNRSILLIFFLIATLEATLNESSTTFGYTVEYTTESTTPSTTESTAESSAASTTRLNTRPPSTDFSHEDLVRGTRAGLTTTAAPTPESTTTCTIPVESRIPLIRTRDGKLFCSVTTGIVSAPNVLMEITYGSSATVSSSPSPEDVHRLTFVTTAGSSWPLNVSVSVMDNGSVGSTLGLGQYSDLMRQFGSIAIYKGQRQNGFEMAVGSSLETFNESCIPDTLLSINPGTIRASVGLYNGTRMEISENGAFILGKLSGYVASIPSLVFDRIRNSISENGNASRIERRRAGNRTSFSNCTRAVLDHLPSIVIRLRHQVGSFMLLPEDYLEFDEIWHVCSMRLMEDVRPHGLMWIDLLQINGMNIRFASDASFDICDSNAI